MTKGKPNRAYVWTERVLLGAGMTVIAAVIDRLLVRTLRAGNVKPAPRTAAGPTPADGSPPPPSGGAENDRHAVLTPPSKKVADEAGR